MNKLKQIFNFENRNKLYQLYRTTPYMSHPELKISNPKNRVQQLLIMRDLRLWVNEYAPWSSRNIKYNIEVEHLNTELNYLQFFRKCLLTLAFAKRSFLFVLFSVWFCYWGPQHWNGAMGHHDRPV
jgi:hypothetical protein